MASAAAATYSTANLPTCTGAKMSPAKASEPRSPSPNYFGLIVEPAADPRDSASLPAQNWSPPSSSIKSFAAALPMPIPLDANPDFEAFRRQIDIRSKGFGLPSQTGIVAAGGSREYSSSPSTGPTRPRMGGRWSTYNNKPAGVPEFGTPSRILSDVWEHKNRMDVDSTPASHEIPATQQQQPATDGFFGAVPPQPPAFTLKMPSALGGHAPSRTERAEGDDKRVEPSRAEDRDPRLSVMGNRLAMPSPPPSGPQPKARSETVPARMPDAAAGPTMLAPAQLRALLQDGPIDTVMLIDIRAAGAFGQSHILNALNLCVPTTLLKRATYNLEKLQGNFANPVDKERFSNWRQFGYLVVYDCRSNELKEAVNPANMIRKFLNEGYQGQTFILRGGFDAFCAAYPDLVELPEAEGGGNDGGAGGSSAKPAPVIGGVSLPASITRNAQNPFFGNIRQNMDLADGVGQLDIARPDGLDSAALPPWLQAAVAQPDHGKLVADKFLRIEREEQARMQRIYTSFGGALASQQPDVQISGIEQGTKNRYKDILPFEHTRVRLQNRPSGACDYVNASHIRATRSNKRYIATQGPLPATFDVSMV
jgi:protein-tyrosine phosphatase